MMKERPSFWGRSFVFRACSSLWIAHMEWVKSENSQAKGSCAMVLKIGMEKLD